MTTPNRIKIIFDGGTAEVYGDVFADMMTCWANQLYQRQKDAQASLTNIKLTSNYRLGEFKAACFNYDDAESRLKIADDIEKVFKNRTGTPTNYVQERPQ